MASRPASLQRHRGSSVPDRARLDALDEPWQFAVLAAAIVVHALGRVGVVATLVGAAVAGIAIALAGGPLPG